MNDISKFTTMSSGIDKAKEWQMELLMEKLRSKACQFKTFTETAKSVRMAMLEKRYPLDSVEKNQHQKCLDSLQHSIKVTSLQSMIERLESLTRQLGLKFMLALSGVELFISSEMFYLEIILDQAGSVRDVKVHHEGKVEQQSCIELVNCLSMGDFADFTAQLEGLSSIYQINAEKKIKCKAFSALQALETDLSTLAQLQTFIKEPFNLLHKSPVGILENRKGGHAMKLTYFVSPYDLLDKEKGISEPLTVEIVTAKNLGYSVTICMEGSTGHKLQTSTIISVNRNINGKNTPSYAPLSNQNSAMLPACFVLRLNKPLPMCISLARRIHQVTDMECGDLSSTHPIMSLITQHVSAGQLDCAHNKGLFVTLPEQHHCYFMTESKNMEGVLINSIPFAHPCHVPQILVYLRQQALFNSVVASCIRTCSKQDFENMIMFEVSALSWQHLSVSLEHPLEESMATAEIDLTDISNVTCKIHTPTSSNPSAQACPDPTSDLASKVFQRCLSIPITMRTVIKLWDEQVNRKNHLNTNENFSLPLGSVDPGGHGGNMGNPLTDFGGLNTKMKHDPGSGVSNGHSLSGISLAHPHQSMFLNESMMSGTNFSPFSGPEGTVNMLNNIEINSLLSGTSNLQQEKSTKRQNKRKASEELWKNPKRKSGEESEMMAETSSSDSTSMSTPTSHDAASEPGIATPNSALGFHSDLELSGLDAAELINTSDKIASEYDCSGEADDLGEMEDMLAMPTSSKSESKSKKSREEKKATLLELPENKNLVPPSVSITPINSTQQSMNTVFPGMGLERRPGIEIIPIASAPPTSLPSSITITPITSTHGKVASDERSRDRKSSKGKSDDKSKLEKKRKRKKNEDTMGPPDKLPPKQDPLTKPVSVSIKPAESSPPCQLVTPTSPSSMLRKFNSSPLSGKSSPSMLKPSGKLSSTHQSPKHSPAHITSSPKHATLPGIPSPKSHGTSPKHPSASSTGKPSMSTLKSAANSPSSKSSDSFKSKSTNKDSSGRDRDKKFSSNAFSVNNPKVKSSSVKLKQLDLSTNLDLQTALQGSDGLPSPSGTMDLSKSASLNQVRNRKGSLSAVIDKLKSAQHCGPEPEGTVPSGNSKSGNREGRGGSLSNKALDAKVINKIGEAKNSEYMVKPSLDGMKITINKTRMKDSSKSSNVTKSQSTGTGSPKTHTGLKPGVNSGPASKKPQQINQKSSSTGGISSGAYGSLKTTSNKVLSSKSSGNLSVSKSMTKSSSSSDLNRNKDNRPRLNKSSSDKSIFGCSKGDTRRGSPTARDDDNDRAFKMLSHSKIDSPYPSSLMMEGMIKSLDTNFQIPKLSARTSDGEKKSSNKVNSSFPDTTINSIPRTLDSNKMYDMMTKNDMSLPKYPISLSTATKTFENNLDPKTIRNNLVSLSSTSPLLPSPLAANPLYTSSSSPKRGLVASQANLKDMSVESAVNLAGTDLSSSLAESSDPKMPKMKDIPGTSLSLISKDDLTSNCKISYPLPTKTYPLVATSFAEPIIKPPDAVVKFSSPQHKIEDKKMHVDHIMKVSGGKTSTSSQEAAEMLLDFSSNSISKPLMSDHLSKIAERSLPLMRKTTSPVPLGPPPSYPASPSVSVHIVKSPAPSPRVNPSPHSVSPCITDDELMDEALVGLGK